MIKILNVSVETLSIIPGITTFPKCIFFRALRKMRVTNLEIMPQHFVITK